MFITSITLKHFRCFTTYTSLLSKPFILVEGLNGSGKTSLLEALYYACYLRSFKTRLTRELINHGTSAFSIKVGFTSSITETAGTANTTLTIGYSPAKRIIKINETAIQSHKELINLYKVIAMTNDDLLLIKGPPEVRRSFLDQAITLGNPDYPVLIKRYLEILQQRNALFDLSFLQRETYDLWTSQLTHYSTLIRAHRQDLLSALEKTVNTLLLSYFENTPLRVQLVYNSKELPDGADLLKQEHACKRTLFGAHLDDYSILLSHKSSRLYASQGQQKLIALLLKLAQPAIQQKAPCIFLLDDIISDLDIDRLTRFFTALSSFDNQIIITAPLMTNSSVNSPLQHFKDLYDMQSVLL